MFRSFKFLHAFTALVFNWFLPVWGLSALKENQSTLAQSIIIVISLAPIVMYYGLERMIENMRVRAWGDEEPAWLFIFRPFSSIVWTAFQILKDWAAITSLVDVLVVVGLLVGLGILGALSMSWGNQLPRMEGLWYGLIGWFVLTVGWLFYKLT